MRSYRHLVNSVVFCFLSSAIAHASDFVVDLSGDWKFDLENGYYADRLSTFSFEITTGTEGTIVASGSGKYSVRDPSPYEDSEYFTEFMWEVRVESVTDTDDCDVEVGIRLNARKLVGEESQPNADDALTLRDENLIFKSDVLYADYESEYIELHRNGYRSLATEITGRCSPY